MRFHKLLLGVLLLGLVFSVRAEEEEFDDIDESDDGIVEEEPEAGDTVPIQDEVPKPDYKHPEVTGNAFLTEAFFHPQIPKRWVVSEAKKEGADEDIAKYDGKWSVEEPADNPMVGDLGLVLKSRARHHAISVPLDRPFEFTGNPLVVQYEVKFQNGLDCGGSYVKLLRQDTDLDLKQFMDKTPFTIMFGPDRCGTDSKLHFIFQHKHPKTGVYEEKQANGPKKKFDEVFSDKKTHLFSLVVKEDNSFEVYVDQNLVNSGSLLEDVNPAVNPPAEIEDPEDKKPEDWDEKEKIPDPEASKPEDWDETQPETIPDEDAVKPEGWLDDEPELIPEPTAEKPEDWDDEMDGEWEAPKIANPECESAPGCGEWTRPSKKNPLYKGKWRAPMISNPNYQGIWKPKIIPNPNFFEDKTPYKMTPIVAVGLELWSMSDDILFDNFIITDDKSVADSWAEKTWALKNKYEVAKEAFSGKGDFFQKLEVMTKEKPWIWAVLLIVIVLPTVLFIAFCCNKTGGKVKDGYINMLLNAGKDRPWMYAIYLVVVLLPVVAISIFLCPSKPQVPQDDDDDAGQRKKTDESSPDVIDEEEQEEDKPEEDDGGAAGGDAPEEEPSKKSGKSALDAEEDVEGDAENDEEEEEEKTTRRSSPRKRKPRKD